MQLYRLPGHIAEAAAFLGIDEEIERDQHVQQLKHKVMAGCRQASTPFTWLRAAGLRTISGALAAGLQDGAALTAVLDATYSQVVEVLLSTLDRDLIPHNRAAQSLTADLRQQRVAVCSVAVTPPHTQGAAGHAAADSAGSGGSSGSRVPTVPVAELLAAVGRCPAGFAPAAADADELEQAFGVLQAVCLLSTKVRGLLCGTQYLQLLIARACEVPSCLPPAMNALLALLQSQEDAQDVFVTAGGLDMLLSRTLEHAQAAAPVHERPAGGSGSGSGSSKHQQARSSSSRHQRTPSSGNSEADEDVVSEGSALTRRQLLLELLLFLQLLLHCVLAGSTSRHEAAVALMTRHLGPAAVQQLTEATPSDGSAGAPDASGWCQSGRLHQQAEAAAAELLV